MGKEDLISRKEVMDILQDWYLYHRKRGDGVGNYYEWLSRRITKLDSPLA